MRLFKHAASLIWLACSAPGFAAMSWEDGTEPEFWDNKAVIVCEVQKFVDAGKASSIQVHVLAVVATDQLIETDLKIEHELTYASSVGGFKPGPGQKYVFLIRQINGDWVLLPGRYGFFESEAAVERISGLKDPKLAKLAKRVSKVREESRVNTVKHHQEGDGQRVDAPPRGQ